MGIEGFSLDCTEGAERGGVSWVRGGACEVGVYGIPVYSFSLSVVDDLERELM